MKQFLRNCLVLVATLSVATAQPAGKGNVTGTVFDAATGRPVPLVQIEVNGVSDGKMSSDTEGRFTITLSPGTYKLRLTSSNHMETTVEDVQVKAGEITEAGVVLQQKGTVTTVDVVEKVGSLQTTAESVLVERKLASTVSDSISKEDIKASTASDAAGALEKVTGISIVDGGFVFVRGLGERYSSTMLNNAMVPTTEPERRVVPLDLFPASLIDSIKVVKTYSADLPGEFSGGLVQMQTTEFPAQKTVTVSVNYGFNSQTFGKRFGSYSGGSRDAFGFDSGNRGLPAGIPADRRLFVGNFSDQEFQQFGRSFNPDYEIRPVSSARPTQTYSISGGNTWGKLGVVAAVTFNNSPQQTPEDRRFLVNSGGGRPQIFSDYKFDVGNESARIGAVLNAAYRFNSSNKIIFRNTLTRDTDKEARFLSGLNGGNGQDILSERLRWTERGLMSTGVEGDHALARLRNSVFHWQFTVSNSDRSEPDLRETIRGREPGSTQPYAFLNLPESGLRFFSELKDKIYEPQADWGIPFFKGKFSGLFKSGFRGTIRRRDFDSRRFRYFPIRAGTIDFAQPTNTVLGANNIRPDGFAVREITRGTDRYEALMDIYGGYTMVDLAIGSRWRVISGVRVEDAQINVTTLDPLVPGGIPSFANLYNRDYLPAVNVIYQLTAKQNLRFGYGRTVNRPDFRELSPFEFTNVVGGYSTVGNPNLRRAKIDNFDARWEWFLGGNQVVAASYFFKKFKDPIEQIYRPTASELRQSFLNVDSARNQGVELEWRQGLGRFSKSLRDFGLQANITVVDSNVTIPTGQFVQLTSANRPLVGQSRYIFNVIAEWQRAALRSNARFYVNSVSRRITDVGTFDLPDVYQERNLLLDFVYEYSAKESGKWKLRFSGENLNNNVYRQTQANFVVRRFQIGRTFTIGTSYTFF